MKSLFAVLSLVLIVGAAFADVPSERKLPIPPQNNLIIDQAEPDKPVNDLPRTIMPVIYPDRNLILPPPVERPPVDRPRFEKDGPGYVEDGHNANGPAYVLDGHNTNGPAYVLDDVPLPRKFPQYPPNGNILEQPSVYKPMNDQPGQIRRDIKPVIKFGTDKPGQRDPSKWPVIYPEIDQNLPPAQDPGIGPNDPPYIGDPDNNGSDAPFYLGIEERGPRGGQDMGSQGPSVRLPFFRDYITVHFGPNANRIPVTGRLFNMSGRLVFSGSAQAGSTVVFSGARLASLPAGNYILQLDCGDGPQYAMKVAKAE